MEAIFKGLRVLDFGRFIAAPWCSAILADLGADVIRVEKREGGEDRFVQLVGPNGAGAGFLATNRNKRSLTLDTTSEEGRAVAAKLIRTADIVVTNMPDTAMRANGLDYETLKSIRSDIILATATAFGRGGPYSNRVGFDGIGQVMSGAVHRTGPPEHPYRTAVPYIDYTTGLCLTIGTMAAIIHRNATGEGQVVEAALLPSALMIANGLLVEEAILRQNRGRRGNVGQAIGPADIFRVKDGWVLLQITGQPMFKRWCRLVGKEEWFSDPRFADDDLRSRNIDELNAHMAEWCGDMTVVELMDRFEAARLPGSPVLSPLEAVNDPHVQAMGYLKPLSYPGLPEPAPIIETPFRLSATPGTIRHRAPTIGEHTDAVLAELGFDAAAIAGLRQRGVL